MSSWGTTEMGWLFGGFVLVSMWLIGTLVNDQRQEQVCECGSTQWDDWTECSTCHECGRLW